MDYNLGTARGVIEIEYRGDGVTQAQKGLRGTAASAQEAGDKASQAGGTIAKSGLVIAGGLALAVKSASDFEARLSAVQAVSGATAGEMEQLRDKSLQLGKDTAFSASESASAIEELVKAGVSVQDVMSGAADATVALAAAGEVSMPEAAAIASNAMNQFGLAAENLPNVADKIAGAANASAIDVKDFGYSLSQVGAVANLAGATFDDTAAAIALMGNAGIKGSDAGTSLKSMLSNLQPTTKQQRELFQELGISTFDVVDGMKALRENGITPLSKDSAVVEQQLRSLAAEMAGAEEGTAKAEEAYQKLAYSTGAAGNAFYDQEGNLKSLSSVAGTLQKSMEGLTKQQQQQALQTMFGADAIRAAAILAENGAEGFDSMAESMGKVTAADVAAQRMDNLAGSVEQLKGSLETLMIMIGTPLLNGIRGVVDGLTGFLDMVLSIPGPVLESASTFLALLAGLMLLVGGFLQVQTLLLALKAGMLLFTGPILLAIAAVAALGAAFVYFYKNNSQFQEFVQKIGSALKDGLGRAIEYLVPILKAFGGFLGDVFQASLPYLQKFGDAILTAFQTAAPYVQALLSALGSFLGYLSSNLMPVVESVGSAILTSLVGAFNKVWPAITALLPAIQSLVSSVVGFVSVLIDRAQPAIDFLVSALGILAQVFITTILPVLMRIGGIFTSVFVNILGNALQTALGVARGVLGIISGVFKMFTGLLTGDWSKAWAGVKQIMSGAVGVIKSLLTGLVKSAGSLISGFGRVILEGVKAIPGLLRGAGRLFLSAGKFLIDQFVNGMKNAAGIISGIASGVWNAVRGLLNGAISRINAALEFTINLPLGKSFHINPPNIPMLAKGGVVDQATLLIAGEAGGEAITPLGWLENQIQKVYLAGAQTDMRDPGAAAGSAPSAPGSETSLRMVSGTLVLDPSGRAFIRGIAEEVVDQEADHQSFSSRRNF